MQLEFTLTKIVAIHQPNFLPWLGYFNKIVKSDSFIILDDVQFPKTGGVWANRHYVMENGTRKWYTIPISRNFSSTKKINEIKFAPDIDWKKNYLKRITHCYSRAKYFSETYQFLHESLAYETDYLCDLNIHLITSVLRFLDISESTLVKSSTLHKSGTSNELLCSLAKAVGASAYLSGGGAEGYMDKSVFKSNGIKIIYQNYISLDYAQIDCSEFVSGVTIIDAMMNCGVVKTKKLVEGVDVV
jgi:hypothetical protein